MAISKGKFYDWKKRYGKVNEHNGKVPRDHWIEPSERQAIIDYFEANPMRLVKPGHFVATRPV